MKTLLNRRQFLRQAARSGVAVGALGFARGTSIAAVQELPKAADHVLTVVSGNPRERGREYGRKFKESIRAFLDQEIYQAFTKKAPTREEVLRYAGKCAKEVGTYSPMIFEELEGMAEGTGLLLEEILLITLHEELYHGGVLQAADHCKAVAAGPPETKDGQTYVGQTWDWMTSTYGKSEMLLWKRPEGPSVLAYAYPGLWIGAGLNSAGVALCWTGAGYGNKVGARVGIPSYVLIAQMLYQETLEAAVEEARRAKQAGWFTFLLANAEGQIANVEGSPDKQGVRRGRGHMAAHNYGTRELTGTPEGEPVKLNKHAEHLDKLLEAGKGKLDRDAIRIALGDHEMPTCVHLSGSGGTVDTFIFNCTKLEAYICRGPGCMGMWKTFGFQDH